MSDSAAFGFGKFIPGFDFLQQLGKAGGSGSVPPLSHWVAPTVSVEEISKRIEELKAVQFWLEQNSRALAATVQALEVQKMTLHTLQGMNVSMADLAQSFAGSAQTMPGVATGEHADWPMSSGGAKSRKKSTAAAKPAPAQEAGAAQDKTAANQAQTDSSAHKADAAAGAAAAGAAAAGAAAGMADPMLWWGALNQQFQQIASQALQDPAQQQAMAKATHMATDFTKAAMQAASAMARQATAGVQAATDAASPAARKTGAKPAAKPAAKQPAPAKKATARQTGARATKPAAGRR